MTTGNYIELALFAVGILLGVYGFIYRLDRRVSVVEGTCEANQKVIDSIATLNSRLDKLQNDNEVFWKVIGPHLEHIIHSPKSVKRDELVSKLTAGTIDADELPILIGMLREALQGTAWSPEKKLAGAWLLGQATIMMNEQPYDRRARRRPA